MNRDIINVGVLGCGAVAQIAHLPAFERTHRARLVALCDSAEDLLAAVGSKYAVDRLYTRFEDLLADPQVEAVLVAVSDAAHVPLSRRALNAGKHVLVEKPLGTNTAECLELAQLVHARGLVLQVGNMKRHDPGVAFAKQFVEERLGPVLSIAGVYRDSQFRQAMQESCLDRLLTSKSPLVAGRTDAKADRETYNLWTQGAHLIDLLVYLGGTVTAVTAQVARLAGQCSWHGLLEFASGSRGHFELTCKSCGDWHEQYTVLGEHGSVDVRVGLPFYHRPAEARAFDGRLQRWIQPLGQRSNSYVNQLEAFAHSVLDRRPANPTADEGVVVVQLLEAISRSIAGERRVTIASIPRHSCV